MSKFKTFLNQHGRLLTEASFKLADLKKVCKNYASLFSKGLGGTLRFWCTETFERDGEDGSGVRMANANGHMLRFNFSTEITGFANAKAIVLSSIDYWKPGNTDLECPDVTCKFLKDVNVIQIWRRLADIIFNGKFGKYTAPALGAPITEAIENYGSVRARKDFLTSKGLPEWRGMSPDNFDKIVTQKGLESEWNTFVATVSPGRPERNSTEDRIKKTEAQVEKTEYGDPNVIFKDIVTLTKHLKKSNMKLLSIFGMGGLGKTYEVKNTLKTVFGPEPSKYWVYIPAGKFSTRKFYEEVFAARDKIICFDEADNIITNDEIVTMLKPALDTGGDNQMTYNTDTKPMSSFSKAEVEEYSDLCDEYINNEGLQFAFGRKFNKKENIVGTNTFDEDEEPTGVWAPSRFFFTGKMIFISNLSKDKIDAALLTRGPKVDVTLNLQGKLARIESVLKAQGHPQSEIDDLMEQLRKRGDAEHVSVRTVVTYLDFKGDEDISASEALRIASTYG